MTEKHSINTEFCGVGHCDVDAQTRQCRKCGASYNAMSEPIALRDGTKLTVVNIMKEGTLLPPAAHLCQKCAVDHDPAMPHNQQSMFWQYWFYKDSGGRWPTWKDAMAHCTDEMKAHWIKALKEGYDIDVEEGGSADSVSG
jgi:ribosomal protein L40E